MLAAGGADDPLDNEEQLADQMDSLPFLARFQYEATAEYLAGLFDPLAVLYKVPPLLEYPDPRRLGCLTRSPSCTRSRPFCPKYPNP